MDFDVLFLTGKEKTTRGLLVRSLAAYQVLTIAQLRSILRTEFSRKLSYQAIRQSLLELMRLKVVLKQKDKYLLSSEWIHQLSDTARFLEHSLTRQKPKVLDNTTTQVRLRNLFDLGYFILYGLEHQYFDFADKDELFLHLHHLWIPFEDPEKRERLKRIFHEHKTRVLINNSSMLDTILLRWYRKHCQVRLGVRSDQSCDYIVSGDCVVQIYMNSTLKQEMDAIYRLRGLLRLDLLAQLSHMTYHEYGIEVVITRNSAIAEQLKNKIRKALKK
jgi:hypothetical protein